MDDDLLDPAIMGNEDSVEEEDELDENGRPIVLPKDDDEVAEDDEEYM